MPVEQAHEGTVEARVAELEEQLDQALHDEQDQRDQHTACVWRCEQFARQLESARVDRERFMRTLKLIQDVIEDDTQEGEYALNTIATILETMPTYEEMLKLLRREEPL